MPIKRKRTTATVVGVMVIAVATPFIAVWEGKENVAYLDRIAEPDVWTVCYGHTGKYASPTARYSDAKCLEILQEDVGVHYAGLITCIDEAKIPVSVQASLLELAFNVGVPKACKSAMVRLANEGCYKEACDQLDRWVRAGGVTVRGLVNRRNASQEMCMADVP